MTTLPKLFLTMDEAAEACGVSRDTIRRALNTGKLRAKRTGKEGGGKYLISTKALQDWFEGLKDA